tara:strand:+ start:340 stop:1362 length:1023 start_codon:yes stop_codon:yes gene_type:complete
MTIQNKYTINEIEKYFKDTKYFNIDFSKLRSKGFYAAMLNNRNEYYKKYKKYLNLNELQSCVLCKSKTKKIFLSWKKYKLYECLNCEVIFSNIDLSKFQNSDFFLNNPLRYKDFHREMVKTFSYRKRQFGNERLNYLREKIGKIAKNYSVLDYGCGCGYFIDLLKDKKIRAKGIDLDQNAVNFCKSKSLNVSNNDIDAESDNSFNLITMFDSIEHFHNPIETLKIANKKLKKNGLLLAYTPNIRSLSTDLLGADHNALAVFDHICLFNKKSLNFIAKKTNFRIISIEYYGLDIKDYLQALSSKENYDLVKKLNQFSNILQQFIDKSELSNSMRIVFQKRN